MEMQYDADHAMPKKEQWKRKLGNLYNVLVLLPYKCFIRDSWSNERL